MSVPRRDLLDGPFEPSEVLPPILGKKHNKRQGPAGRSDRTGCRQGAEDNALAVFPGITWSRSSRGTHFLKVHNHQSCGTRSPSPPSMRLPCLQPCSLISCRALCCKRLPACQMPPHRKEICSMLPHWQRVLHGSSLSGLKDGEFGRGHANGRPGQDRRRFLELRFAG